MSDQFPFSVNISIDQCERGTTRFTTKRTQVLSCCVEDISAEFPALKVI